MSQSLSQILIHGVFSTKNRQPYLAQPSFRDDMHAFLGGVSNKLGCPPIAVDGAEDHVHILVRFGRNLSIASWIKEVKRNSSLYVKGRISDFAWQAGYGVFSVDPSNRERVSAYI